MHYLDYAEKRVHGTDDFPVAFYHIDCTHPRYEMPFHWHRELEIIRVLKGTFTLYRNHSVQTVGPGDIALVNSGVLHGGSPSDCVYECIVFNPFPLLMHTDTCRQYVRFLTGRHVLLRPFFPAGSEPFCSAADRLFDAMQRGGPGSELVTLGILFELFGLIYQTGSYETQKMDALPDDKSLQLLKPVLEYIDKNYMQPVTLEQLAEIAGMSPRYFCRFFRTFIHKTPIDYLNYYRVEQACSLLTAASVSVTDAAYRCGFNDSSYFVKVFRKYKHLTPRQYQKQYR